MPGTGRSESSRAERRRRSEASIVRAAVELFADLGYERTTIRAVAARAGFDPSLVMQLFGSKEGLFAAAAQWTVPLGDLVAVTDQQLAAAAVQHVLDAFEDDETASAARALLRSGLTHPVAEEILRDRVIGETQRQVEDNLRGPDAALRAGLINACTLGLSISRYLLRIPAVAEATADDIQRVLGPALWALIDGSSDPAAAAAGSSSGGPAAPIRRPSSTNSPKA